MNENKIIPEIFKCLILTKTYVNYEKVYFLDYSRKFYIKLLHSQEIKVLFI